MDIGTVLLILVVGILTNISFLIGASVGQKVAKEQEIEPPNLNPIKAVKNTVKDIKAERHAKKEQEKIDTLFENIENYDGTSLGQKDIP